MMIPILVISLAQAIDRRVQIESQLTSLSLPFTVINATDGALLSEDKLVTVYANDGARREIGRPLSREEVGCYLSHVEAWREIADRECSFGLVLEDDAVLDPKMRDLVARASSLPLAVDVCNLSPTNRKTPYKSSFVRRRRVLPDHTLIRVFGHMWGCVAYLIRPSAARLLLDHAFPIVRPADGFWSEHVEPRLRLYTVEPHLVASPTGDCTQSHLEASRSALRKCMQLVPPHLLRPLGWRGRLLRRTLGDSGRLWLRDKYSSFRSHLKRWT